MNIFDRIYAFLGGISLWAVWAAGTALLLSAFMIGVEIVGRKLGGTEIFGLFTMPQFRIPGSDEYSGYVFAGGTVWAYAYCLIHRSHIRIDALYNVLPAGVRAFLDVFGLVLLGIYITYFTNKAWGVFLESWDRNSVSVTPQLTPLWIPQIFWVTGLTFFTIVTLFLIVYTSVALLTGRIGQVQQLAGTMSVQEEVAEETKGVKELDR
ncbi:MAG: TRAP transporter small permease [Pseudomonadota bacterium]